MHSFEAYLLGLGLKRSTVEVHIERVKRLQRLGYTSDPQAYISHLLEEGRTNSYCNRIITAYKKYCDYLHKPCELQYLKEKHNPNARSVLTLDEIEALVNCPPTELQSKTLHRTFSFFFLILAITGCRPGEVASLRLNGPNRLDLGQMALVLSDTKTEPRIVPLGDIKIPKWVNQKRGYIFHPDGKPNQKIQSRNWRWAFTKRLEILGIKREGLSVYSLRHSFITHMVDETTIDIFTLQKLVGHTSSETTQRYYHSSLKKLRKGVELHPMYRKNISQEELIERLKKHVDEFVSKYPSKIEIQDYNNSPNQVSFTFRLRS